MKQLLRIYWKDETEYVAFDEDDNMSNQLKTTARWRDSREVTYEAEALLAKKGRSRTLRLTYNLINQTDPYIKNQAPGEIRYGVSVITWCAGQTKGRAEWHDNEQGTRYDGVVKVAVLGGRKLETSERATKSLIVRPRPQQAAFRDALFQLDKQCVLTGEKCREALQAAHLVPVAGKGYEQIENGILLRADLHLLFDAGLLWFNVSDDHAAVKYSLDDLTYSYQIFLKDKRLPSDTFRRVKAALLARTDLPGGRGREALT